MKRIKIRLSRIERDKHLEIWESIYQEGQTPLFFCRETHSPHNWFNLPQPFGVCEPGSAVGEDIEFIVCGKQWNELFHDGNGSRNVRFISLEELCKEKWEEIKPHFPKVTQDGFSDWILSKATNKLDDTDRLNWITMWHKDIRHRIIRRFQFLREDYAIYCVTRKHTRCEICWNEYFAGPVSKEKHEDWVTWCGTEFSDKLSDYLLAKDKVRYIVNPNYFTGTIITSMSDGIHCDYSGKNLEELQCKENNSMLQAVTDEELNCLWKRWETYLQGPFWETTKERYWDWLECLPPVRHRNGSFFISEAYTGSLHRFCFKRENRYFTALRSKNLSDAELDSQIEAFIKELKTKELS